MAGKLIPRGSIQLELSRTSSEVMKLFPTISKFGEQKTLGNETPSQVGGRKKLENVLPRIKYPLY